MRTLDSQIYHGRFYIHVVPSRPVHTRLFVDSLVYPPLRTHSAAEVVSFLLFLFGTSKRRIQGTLIDENCYPLTIIICLELLIGEGAH